MPTPDFNPETLQCQECENTPATLFVTKTVGNQVIKQSLCEACARRLAAQKLGERATHAPLEDVLRVLFQNNLGGVSAQKSTSLQETAASPDWWHSLVEFSSDEDVADDEAEAIEQLDAAGELDEKTVDEEPDPFASTRSKEIIANEATEGEIAEHELAEEEHAEREASQNEFAQNEFAQNEFAASSLVPSLIPSLRCPKCGTTWDRLKQDGRAGCSQCYVAFADELVKVLDKMQGASIHEGKTPRTMDKRQKRLMHLRLRRDHRLQMLNRRLEESLDKEDYEEAAKLRDKIKVVSSTILEE